MVCKIGRAGLRPHRDQWDLDEPMTLAEAAAVFFPDGPLTLSSLRTAVRDGDLAIARVAGKILTTPRAIREMTKPCRAEMPSRTEAGTGGTAGASGPGPLSAERLKAAQAAALATIAQLQAESRASLRTSKAEARAKRAEARANRRQRTR